MLRQMTWREFLELEQFFTEKERRREELQAQAQESKLRQFFLRLRGKQQAEEANGEKRDGPD